MKPFAIDRHGRLALPCHFFPAVDFAALDSVEQLTAVIQRDFDSKDPSGAELAAERDPDRADRSLLDAVDLVVPHQANRTMLTRLAAEAGLACEKLYFNIHRVGNLSSASVPVAMADAVREAVIRKPARVFAPCFGAGAVAGYALMRLDPRIVAVRGRDSARPTPQPQASAQASMSQ